MKRLISSKKINLMLSFFSIFLVGFNFTNAIDNEGVELNKGNFDTYCHIYEDWTFSEGEVAEMDTIRLFLECNNESIESIAPGTFDGVENIKKFYINSKIKEIPTGVFNNLNNLYELKLYGEFNTIEPGVLPNSLKKLDLYNNKITKLLSGAFPDGLQELDLRYNEINEIEPGAFPNSLEKLYISDNKITKLSSGTFPDGLPKIDLGRNEINEIEIGAFPNSLQEIDLYNNKITELSPGIFPSGLQKLNLSANKITEISTGVFPFGVQEIDLGSNEIDKIEPGTFPNSLKKLNLYDNKISKLLSGAFYSGLQELDLSYNEINEIEPGSFQRGLQNIRLYNNNINKISLGIFPSGLQELDLSVNKITEISTGLFPDSIKYLNLSYNEIEKIADGAFSNTNNLKKLNLEGNPVKNFSKHLGTNNVYHINIGNTEINSTSNTFRIFPGLLTLCIIILLILLINVIYKKFNSREKEIGIKLSSASNLGKKDVDKLKDKYLNTFSKFGFIFPIYTAFRSKKIGIGIGILLYKIVIGGIFVTKLLYDISNGKLLNLIIFSIIGYIILNIPNYFIGCSSKKILYSTGKFKSIKEMYEKEKRKEKISIFLLIVSPFIKILLLGLFSVCLYIIILGLSWRN